VADGFTSPPKEGMLRICITLKNTLPRRVREFEPANLVSDNKHANHYTTEATNTLSDKLTIHVTVCVMPEDSQLYS
jgi:hypothetical protein